jgi:hypothetical protein
MGQTRPPISRVPARSSTTGTIRPWKGRSATTAHRVDGY